jgi:hypothetical protein
VWKIVEIVQQNTDKKNRKFWEELIAYSPLTQRGQHRKRRVQKLYCCCVCIRCRGNVFTETLPSNDRGTHVQMEFMKYAVEIG